MVSLNTYPLDSDIRRLSITEQWADPDLQINKGKPGHPDPEIWGAVSKRKFPSGLSVV